MPAAPKIVNVRPATASDGEPVSNGKSYHDTKAFEKSQNIDDADVINLPRAYVTDDLNKMATAEAVVATPNNDNTQQTQTAEPVKAVPLFSLFRFADKIDIVLMVIASLCSIAHGAAMPLLLVVFGDLTQKFVSHSGTNSSSASDVTIAPEVVDSMRRSFMDTISVSCGAFAGIGAAVLFIGYGQVAFWLMTSNRQTLKIRTNLLRAVLRQEVGWFDTNDSGGISGRLSDDANKIQEGIGDKLGTLLQNMSTCLIGLIIALVRGWKLALVCLSVSPVIAVCGSIVMKLTVMSTSKELTAYAKAGAIASEVFGCIRTVIVFAGQEKECARYSVNLVDAKKTGVRKSMVSGAGMGVTYFVLFSSYCLAFWFGGKLIRGDEINVGTMLIVFFCVMTASMAIGNASPSLQVIGQARGAAYFIWNIIDRKPEIDSSSNNGLCPDSFTGDITFKDVSFRYPSRPDTMILNGLSLVVKKGQTVALVGSSGCGKSTVIQLLQRFYDPLGGSVLVDGNDITELNIRWLRQHIGVVSQEPVLFAMSIADNIRYGREGVTQSEIEKAAEEANAHSFISDLPLKYDTLVGERGAQLSGGQKQRIAIARALVRDPKILLLDEATSALDTGSEAIVQEALDKARQGRTTIIVAHRLSTIRSADVIYGLKSGKVEEFGTHEELMNRFGIYHQLVTSQKMNVVDSEGTSDNEDDVIEHEIPGCVKLSRGSLRDSKQSLRRAMKSPNSVNGVKVVDAGDVVTDEEQEKLPDIGLSQLLRLNAAEWYFIVLGCISSVIHGGLQPVVALLFGGILGIYGGGHTKDEQADQTLFLALMYLVIGFGSGLSFFFSVWFFGLSGEALTMRMRMNTFRALLRQDMSFFDNPLNGAGALTTRLATDASAVQGATGVRIGMLLQAVSTIGIGIVIAFIYSWKFALFVFGVMPFMLLGAVMQMRIAKGFSMKNQLELEEAGKTAAEAISNIRTVASLCKEDTFVTEYIHLLEPSHRQNMRTAHLFGFAFSFMQAMIFFGDAAIFYFGAWLITYDGLQYDAMFKVFGAIIFGAFSLGRESQFAPDYGKAKMSAARIFGLLAKQPLIDNYSREGLTPNRCDGKIELSNVEFSYPNRSTVKVMKGTNLTVEPGKTFALVGQTGCGKSTTIQLLERLYDPSIGKVTIDGVDVRRLNVSWVRSQLGLVSQEPVLFDYSIRENIEYGDNARHVNMDEVIAAARASNIHNFIESLPEGYETRVGDKGTQLSGGQKQRIAIARALVRNPKILLLDEATSALDTESEKVVQEALDRAQTGRTCLVIAHRLSTIQNAHRIVVFQNGRVAEQGTHTELMNFHQGLYYKLQNSHVK